MATRSEFTADELLQLLASSVTMRDTALQYARSVDTTGDRKELWTEHKTFEEVSNQGLPGSSSSSERHGIALALDTVDTTSDSFIKEFTRQVGNFRNSCGSTSSASDEKVARSIINTIDAAAEAREKNPDDYTIQVNVAHTINQKRRVRYGASVRKRQRERKRVQHTNTQTPSS